MNKKIATYLSLIFIVFIGLFFLIQSKSLMNNSSEDPFGPGYLPFWLSIILFILCIISFIKTIAEKTDEKITVHQLHFIILTALIIIIFTLSWSFFGYFYLHSFVFMLILLTIYRSSLGWTVKNIVLNTAIAFGFTVFIYALFDIIVKISL